MKEWRTSMVEPDVSTSLVTKTNLCKPRGKIDLADRPARCLHHYSHASVASMLGKILHFKFPPSYYMGGDANTLNWAINSTRTSSSARFECDCWKGDSVFQTLSFQWMRVLFWQSHIVYVQISERQRNTVFFLCIMNLCQLLVSRAYLQQNSPFWTEKGGVFLRILASSLSQICIPGFVFSPSVDKKCLIPSVPLSEQSPSVSLASAVCSTHAALSPFQSQYLVVIAADCFQGGDDINTQTCRSYVTPPFTLVFLFWLSILHPWGEFLCLVSLYCICSLCISSLLFCMHLLFPSTLSVCLCLSRGRLWIINLFSVIASENNLVSDHLSSVLLTQPHIILFYPSRNISAWRLWSLRCDYIPFFIDITLNLSVAHFLYYTTRWESAILGVSLSPGSVSVSRRHSIKLAQIWRPSDIRGRSGRLRSHGGGEDVMDGVSGLVSSDLPSSKVPRATIPSPDASLVMHQQTYATCSWIIKVTYAAVTLWAPSCVTLKVHPQVRALTHCVISWNCHLGILMQR